MKVDGVNFEDVFPVNVSVAFALSISILEIYFI